MKFAVIALISTAAAVRIMKGDRPMGPPPTGADIVAHCGGVDEDKDHISKDEAWTCISAEIPEEFHDQAQQMFDEMWTAANFGDDGADAAEIDAIMAAEEPMREGRPPKALAKRRGKATGLAKMLAKATQGPKRGPPTGADIVAHCGGGDDHVSKEEAWTCISAEDENVTKDMFEAFWAAADFGADGADAAEIDALIAQAEGPRSLAQLARQGHPTGADIVAHCGGVDEDKDHVSKHEAWTCISAEEPNVTQDMFDHFWTMANFGDDGADAAEIDAIIAEMEKPPRNLGQIAAAHPTGAEIVAHCG